MRWVQTAIAEQICRQNGDYILTLKANQGKLYRQVQNWFEQARQDNFDCYTTQHSYDSQLESGHHRIEKRQLWVVPVSELLSLHRLERWCQLTSV